MKEEQKHIDAYNMFFRCRQEGKGVEQCVGVLCRHYHIVRNTVYRWYRSFHWKEREANQRTTIQKKVERDINESIADVNARHERYLVSLMEQAMADPQIRPKSVSDVLNIMNILRKYAEDAEAGMDKDKIVRLITVIMGEDYAKKYARAYDL